MNHGAPFSPSPPGIRVTRSVYSAAVGEEMALSLAGGLRCGLCFLDWAQDSALFYYVLGVKVHALLPRGCIETPIAHPKKRSEERRVGKECRDEEARCHDKKKI